MKQNKKDIPVKQLALKYKIVSLENLASCYIDLWDIEEAIKCTEEFGLLAENTEWHRYAVDSWYLLAYLNSCLGHNDKASDFAEKAYNQISVTKWSAFSQGYSLLFLGTTYKNLGKIQKSFEMYQEAIQFAEESHYTQVRAKALTGIAELYREQGDFETAIANHSESIELLDKIGAKCDLAEAYYQLGLTYKKMSDPEKSQENFAKAIQLFSEMEAPKQVEKVRRAMENRG